MPADSATSPSPDDDRPAEDRPAGSSNRDPHSSGQRSAADLQLETRLRQSTRFQELRHVDHCESTQDLAATGAGSLVCWADEQIEGRGRQGRSWSGARRRDIEATFRIDDLHGVPPERMAAAAPIAVLAAIETVCGRRLRFKWPNDIFAEGRKLCGTLIDYDGPRTGRYLVGVGVNVNRTSFPPELYERATSLTMLAGHEFDRHELVFRIAASLEAVCGALVGGHAEIYGRMLRARAEWFDRRVRIVRSGAPPVVGRVVELDLDRMHVANDGGGFVGMDVPLATVTRIQAE